MNEQLMEYVASRWCSKFAHYSWDEYVCAICIASDVCKSKTMDNELCKLLAEQDTSLQSFPSDK